MKPKKQPRIRTLDRTAGKDQVKELFPQMQEWEKFMDAAAERACLPDGWDEFQFQVCSRMIAGATDYEGESFQRPLYELLGEALQEPEDVAGWCSIMCSRLRNMGHGDMRIGPLIAELVSISAEAFTLWARLRDLQGLLEAFDEQEFRRRLQMAGR